VCTTKQILFIKRKKKWKFWWVWFAIIIGNYGFSTNFGLILDKILTRVFSSKNKFILKFVCLEFKTKKNRAKGNTKFISFKLFVFFHLCECVYLCQIEVRHQNGPRRPHHRHSLHRNNHRYRLRYFRNLVFYFWALRIEFDNF